MADIDLVVHWAGDLRFEGGRTDGPHIVVDGANAAAPSPVELLLLSLTSCMAADIVEITQKMRVPLVRLSVRAEGDRAAEPPRRYTRLRLRFSVAGAPESDEPKLARALDLSRDKYCSVLHSLDPTLPIELSLSRE